MQKKEYKTPKLKVIVLKHRSSLLQSSDNTPGYEGPAGFNTGFESESRNA